VTILLLSFDSSSSPYRSWNKEIYVIGIDVCYSENNADDAKYQFGSIGLKLPEL
jgi:hypothetical protein